MKKITLLTFLFAVIMPIVSHAQQNDPEFLRAKIEKFSRMKRTGIVMLVAGSASTVGGIVLLANADWEKTSTGNGSVNYNSNDGNALFGMLLTGVGVGLMGGGIPLALIGHNKAEKYKGQLLSLTMVPIVETNYSGIHLALRF